MSTRALIYARVSTEDQLEKYGLPAQIRACREFVASHGLVVVEEISDDGITGTILERPGLNRVRQLVREGAADVVVTLDPDRLSRILLDLLKLKAELDERARIEFVTGSFEKSPNGELFFEIKGAIAKYERSVLRQRMMRGRRERVLSGLLGGGWVPYGYRYEAGRMIPVEDQAAVVRNIFHWFDGGLSMRGIAQRLRAQGVPSAKEKPWGHTSVSKLLMNETFAGVAHYFTHIRHGRLLKKRNPEDRISISVPALIERALWDRVQGRILQGREEGARRGGPNTDRFLLKGILFCSCGRRMAGESSRRWHAYRCSGRDRMRAHTDVCVKGVNARRLDGAVWTEIVATFTDAQKLQAALAAREAQLRVDDPERLPQLEELARRMRRREETALSMMFDPDLIQDRPSIKRQYQEAQRERLRVAGEIAAAERASVGRDASWVDDTAKLLAEYIPTLSGEPRQEFVRGLVARADWDGQELRMRCFLGPEPATTGARCGQFSDRLEILLIARLAA